MKTTKERFIELIRKYDIVKMLGGEKYACTLWNDKADLIISREISDGVVICKVLRNTTDLTGEDIQLICEGPEKIGETDSKFCLIW